MSNGINGAYDRYWHLRPEYKNPYKINDTTDAHEQQTREENNKGSKGVGKSNC